MVAAYLWRQLDATLHVSAQTSPLDLWRHKALMASLLVRGTVVAALFPLVLIHSSGVDLYSVLVISLMLMPLVNALYLSRTGLLRTACLVSVINTLVVSGCLMAAMPLLGASALLILLCAAFDLTLVGKAARGLWVGLALAAVASVVSLFSMDDGRYITSPMVLQLIVFSWVISSSIVVDVAMAMRQSVSIQDDSAGTSSKRPHDFLESYVRDSVTRHTLQGVLVEATQSTGRLLFCESEDLMGDGYFSRVHVADRPLWLQALSDARLGQPLVIQYRLRQGTASHYVWVESVCHGLPYQDGDVILVTHDISRYKAQEADLEHAKAQAEQASLAKTRFLANMSHELRTPLNAIIGFSEIISSNALGEASSDKYQEYGQLIHGSGVHLLQVVNDILDMSKIETNNFTIVAEPFDVRSLMTHCMQMLNGQAEKRQVKLEIDCEDALPELVADKRACKQILINLLSNGIKFSHEGGVVSLKANLINEDMLLSVVDHGIGIAATDLPRLGSPFFQAEAAYGRRYEGTGLGLSVVKGLVELHGGSLHIESELAHGTRVTVRLPYKGCQQLPRETHNVRELVVADVPPQQEAAVSFVRAAG